MKQYHIKLYSNAIGRIYDTLENRDDQIEIHEHANWPTTWERLNNYLRQGWYKNPMFSLLQLNCFL